MKKIIDLKPNEFGDDFKCHCGNNSADSGFFACDEKGNLVEPDKDWKDLYCCLRCNQIYRVQ